MANGFAKPVHVRLDGPLDQLITHEMNATGWTRSQVVRYLLRRAADMRITPQEAGAAEGFNEGVAAVKEHLGQALTHVFEGVQEKLR